jgi:hypothetical protein
MLAASTDPARCLSIEGDRTGTGLSCVISLRNGRRDRARARTTALFLAMVRRSRIMMLTQKGNAWEFPIE